MTSRQTSVRVDGLSPAFVGARRQPEVDVDRAAAISPVDLLPDRVRGAVRVLRRCRVAAPGQQLLDVVEDRVPRRGVLHAAPGDDAAAGGRHRYALVS